MTKVSSSMNRFPVLEFHELANCWPLASKAEHDELVKGIKEHGQKDKITLFEGKILDGRNRYNACKEAGIKPLTEKLKDGEDPTAFVIAKNSHRRNLSAAQKAAVGVKIKEVEEKRAEERRKQAVVAGNKTRHGDDAPVVEGLPPLAEGKSRDIAGAAVGVSGKTIDNMEAVLTKGCDDLVAAVQSEEIGIETAAKFVKLVPDKAEQAAIVKQGPEAVRKVLDAKKKKPKQSPPQNEPSQAATQSAAPKPSEKDNLPEDPSVAIAARVRGLLSSADFDIVLREVLSACESMEEEIAALRRVRPELVKTLEGENAKEAVAASPPPVLEDPHDAALNTFNQFDEHGKQIVYETTCELWSLQIGKKPRKVFKRPTLDEVRAFCKERNNSVDPEAFVDFYSANGWKLSNGNAMQDWQSAVRNWERRDRDKPKSQQPQKKQDPAHRIYVPKEPAPALGVGKNLLEKVRKLTPLKKDES